MTLVATSSTDSTGVPKAETLTSVQEAARKPEWAPRMWEGCDFLTWLRLLWRNRLAVHWSCWYIAVIITSMSLLNTLFRLVQEIIYGRRIRRTIIKQPPIFILGHWRTGTTLLHELLIRDPRHNFPTTFKCLEPHHFLLTEKFFTRWLRFLMPKRRPMDNMRTGWDHPQEDEFALCMLGQPSPYMTIAFPNRPPQCQEYLDLEKVPAPKVAEWKRTFLRFLKQVTLSDPRRLVLKSPPHTARIKILKEMFPDALFVHIVRNPFIVFPSTMNLWRTLYCTQGLQKPIENGLEEHVLSTFVRMYDRLEEGRKLLDAGQFHEMRYEDLVLDPLKEMRKLYDHFQLGGFDDVVPQLREYLAGIEGYETNRYQLTPREREEVARRWNTVICRYGYGNSSEWRVANGQPAAVGQ